MTADLAGHIFCWGKAGRVQHLQLFAIKYVKICQMSILKLDCK